MGLTRIHRYLHVTDIGSGLAIIAQRKETPEFVLTRAEYMFGSAFDGTLPAVVAASRPSANSDRKGRQPKPAPLPQPMTFQDAFDTVTTFVRSAQPAGTRVLYERYQKDFGAFCEARGVTLTKSNADVWIALYMQERMTGTGYGAGKRLLAPSTVSSAVTGAIADIFRFEDMPPPTRSAIVSQVKRAARRSIHPKSKAKDAIPMDLLRAVLQKCYDLKSRKGYRDASILLVMFSCWLRQSEVMRLKPQNITYGRKPFRGQIRDVVTIEVEWAKNDQEHKGSFRTVPKNESNPKMCPYTILKRYAQERNERYTLFFYNLQWNLKSGAALSSKTPTHILRSYLTQLKVSPSEQKKYASNSLRKAGVTAAVASGADRVVIQRHAGWKSARTIESYNVGDPEAELALMDAILNGTEESDESDDDEVEDADDGNATAAAGAAGAGAGQAKSAKK